MANTFFFVILTITSSIVGTLAESRTIDYEVGLVSESVENQVAEDLIINGTEINGQVDWVDTWLAPQQIREWFPYEVTGLDYEGAPVYINHYGKWRFRDLILHGGDEGLQLFEKYYAQLIRKFARHAERGDDGAVIIFDFDGFSLGNFAHPEAIRLSLKQFSTMEKVTNGMKFGFVINSNFAAQLFINTARPFLGTFLEKVEIYGPQREKWIPQLLRRIPADALPRRYGGIL